MNAVTEKTSRRRRGKPSRHIDLKLQKIHEVILHHVHYHRVVRTSHIQDLTGLSYDMTKYHLRKLRRADYLDCSIDPRDERRAPGNPETLHALGNKGLTYICSFYGIPRPKTNMTDANRDLRHIDHRMLITDFMVALELACERSPDVQLLKHTETYKLKASFDSDPFGLPILHADISDGVGGKQPATSKCDKFFGLRVQKNGRQRFRFYFLEADESTITQRSQSKLDPRTIRKKMQVYYFYRAAKTHQEELRIPDFGVLWLTGKSEERFQNMMRHNRTIHDGGWPNFLFEFRDNILSAPDVLSAPWYNGQGKRRTLLSGIFGRE